MNDEPQQINVKDQYPTATKVENGMAFDISGKQLGAVKGMESDQDPFAGATAAPAPGQSQDLFAGATAAPAPGQQQDPFAGATAAPGPTVAELSKGQFIGPRYPAIDPTKGSAGREYSAQVFEQMKEDIMNGTDQTWVGWLLRKMGAKGASYGVSPQTAHLVGGPLLGVTEVGHAASIAPEHPIVAGNELLTGIGDVLGPAAVTQPEALPFMVLAGGTSKGVSAVAKQMGADDETAELIGNVAGIVAGGKLVGKSHLIDKFESSSNTYIDAQRNYVGRLREYENASRQASQAETEAIAARKAESQGGLNAANRIQIEEKASAARANAAKAQKALDQVTEVRDQAGVKMRGIARQIQGARTIAKMDARRVKEVAGAHDDFKSMAPPTRSGPASYSDADLAIARTHLEDAHTPDKPLKTIQDHFDALEAANKGIDQKIDPYIQKYANEPLKANVKMEVADRLAEQDRSTPGFLNKGLNELSNRNITDMTMKEADALRETLNAENRKILSKYQPGTIEMSTLLKSDPEFAANYYAQEAIRNGIDQNLQDHGIQGIREMRRDQSSIIKVKEAVRRQLGRGDQVVRGTGQSGPLRRAAAYLTKKGTTAVGAGVGEEVLGPLGAGAGAVAGSYAGEKLGKLWTPEDLTRDELASRTMETRGAGLPTSTLSGGPGTPPIIPEYERPPLPSTAMSPEQIRAVQRELTPLHSELATYYGEHVTDASYESLEQRLRDDIDDKRSHGIALESEEKTLLGKINQQNAADALAAKEAAQQEALSGKRPVGEATLPEKSEPTLAIMGDRPNGMNTMEILSHELAHAVVADEKGIPVTEIRSENHPVNQRRARAASAEIDWSDFLNKEGGIDHSKIATRIADLAATYVAGGVANDLWHNIPFTENKGLGADLSALRDLMKTAGFTDAETSRLIAQAADDARQSLSRPGVQDVIEQHAQVREPGLRNTLHYSEDRLQQIYQDVKGGKNEARKPTRPSGKGERGVEGPGAGRGRTVQGQGGEVVREKSEGTREGEGTKPGESEPSSPSAANRNPVESESEGKGVAGTEKSASAVDVKPENPAVARVASLEEMNRPGRFVKISRSGMPTDQGKTPDFNLQPGEAGYQVKPGGGFELKAGVETPATRRGVEGYARQVFPESPAMSKTPQQIVEDEGLKYKGELVKGSNVHMFEHPEHPGKTAALEGPLTPESVRTKMTSKLREFGVKEPKKAFEEHELRDAANQFAKSKGLADIKTEPVGEDPRSSEIADAYKNAIHNPNDPRVKASYDALKRDVKDQYHLAKSLGIRMGVEDENPYGLSSEKPAHEQLHDDVRNNKHLAVWSGGAPPADHPLSEIDPETGLTYNSLFRMVHDIFGYAAERQDFSPSGEETAWNLHRQMFSPEARPALMTETKGQAAYTYKYGDFPPQKAAILPEQYHVRPEDLTGGHWSDQVTQKPFGGVNPNNPEAPSKTYGFEIIPEHRHNPSELTAEEAKAYAERPEVKNALAAHPDIKLGWDTTTQGPELNVGASTDDLDTAKKIAGKLDQRAIVNTKTGDEIPAGGEGKRTQFPEYPIEQRLKDLGTPESPALTKGSTTELMQKPLNVSDSTPTDVAMSLSKFTKKQLPKLELGTATPEEMKSRAKDILMDEARYQLAQNNAGQNWYTKDVQKHDGIMQQIRPELKDPAKLSLFKMAEAVLSAGHDPVDNVGAAVRAWDHYQETGEFSPVNPDSGEPWGRYGIKSYGNAFDIINRLIQEKGEKGASDWLLSDHKVSELRDYNKAKRGGRGGGIPGEPDDVLPGVFVLGEKRGPFAQNLHGQEAAFTHDQWVNRSWNRWMGTAELDKEGKLVDQPRNTKERQIVKQSFEEAAKEMNMSPSSLQAVLWYYEKALYEAHGVTKVGATTFSEGAQKVADDEATTFNFGANKKTTDFGAKTMENNQ